MGDTNTIVLYPSPERGHIISMIELGKLISKHHPRILITIIIIHLPNETTSSTDSCVATVSSTTPSIKFIHLPAVDSLPPNPMPMKSASDVVASLFDLPQLNNSNLHHALSTLSKSANIKAFVIDVFCNAATQVSSSFNIPTYYFCTSNANGLCHFLYWWPTVRNKMTMDTYKDLDDILLVDVPDGIPRIASKNIPSFLLNPSHRLTHYSMDAANQMNKSAGLIINSFESLESRAIKAIAEGKYHSTPGERVPPIYCVGPLVCTLEGKEEHECLTWLDYQPSRSVVFLCFGSKGVFSAKQLKEMAIGLEKSGIRFMWVVRNPPPDSNSSECTLNMKQPNLDSFLPEGFIERTKDRGFVVKSWAPQVAVLNHGSVGLFVTHCGWNSILESVCAGVPMLAWPLYAEQKMNRIFLEEDMKMGLSVTQSEDMFVGATELEQRLTELMCSEKGGEIQKQVAAMKEAASEAMSEGGSSRVALAQLVGSFKIAQ